MSLLVRFRQQPKFCILLESLVLLVLIGIVDADTGYELSMFAFYGLPILMAVWFTDEKSAYIVAILSGFVWLWADLATGHHYSTHWMLIWNVCMRLFFFLFLVIGGNAMKSQRETFAARLEVVNQLRLLEQEIVTASEREKQRIGQDIHDGLCQHLAAVCFAAAALKEDLESKCLPEAASAREIEELVKDGISQARSIARGLAPVPMDETGLISALDDLSSRLGRLSDLECQFETTGQIPLLAPETASHLFRIAQEAVNNIIKHAHARHVEITLSGSPEITELSIRDDGVGISPTALESDGMGGKTMQYRARIIGAELQIRADEEEGGTCVTCRLPVSHHPNP